MRCATLLPSGSRACLTFPFQAQWTYLARPILRPAKTPHRIDRCCTALFHNGNASRYSDPDVPRALGTLRKDFIGHICDRLLGRRVCSPIRQFWHLLPRGEHANVVRSLVCADRESCASMEPNADSGSVIRSRGVCSLDQRNTTLVLLVARVNFRALFFSDRRNRTLGWCAASDGHSHFCAWRSFDCRYASLVLPQSRASDTSSLRGFLWTWSSNLLGKGGYVLEHVGLLAEHNQESFFPARYLGIRTIAGCERRDLPLRQISSGDEAFYPLCRHRHSPNSNGVTRIFIESDQATALSLARPPLTRAAP